MRNFLTRPVKKLRPWKHDTQNDLKQNEITYVFLFEPILIKRNYVEIDVLAECYNRKKRWQIKGMINLCEEKVSKQYKKFCKD